LEPNTILHAVLDSALLSCASTCTHARGHLLNEVCARTHVRLSARARACARTELALGSCETDLLHRCEIRTSARLRTLGRGALHLAGRKSSINAAQDRKHRVVRAVRPRQVSRKTYDFVSPGGQIVSPVRQIRKSLESRGLAPRSLRRVLYLNSSSIVPGLPCQPGSDANRVCRPRTTSSSMQHCARTASQRVYSKRRTPPGNPPCGRRADYPPHLAGAPAPSGIFKQLASVTYYTGNPHLAFARALT
jgi:hypothetical protein